MSKVRQFHEGAPLARLHMTCILAYKECELSVRPDDYFN